MITFVQQKHGIYVLFVLDAELGFGTPSETPVNRRTPQPLHIQIEIDQCRSVYCHCENSKHELYK